MVFSTVNNHFHFSLQFQEYDEEIRGVHAKEPLEPDNIIIEIPLKCLITVEMGKETDVSDSNSGGDSSSSSSSCSCSCSCSSGISIVGIEAGRKSYSTSSRRW